MYGGMVLFIMISISITLELFCWFLYLSVLSIFDKHLAFTYHSIVFALRLIFKYII